MPLSESGKGMSVLGSNKGSEDDFFMAPSVIWTVGWRSLPEFVKRILGSSHYLPMALQGPAGRDANAVLAG